MAQPYETTVNEVLLKLMDQHSSGEAVDVHGALQFLDPKQNNTPIQQWLATTHLMDKAEFNRQLKQIQRNRNLERDLGFVPKDAQDFVEKFTKHHGIDVLPDGQLKQDTDVQYGDAVITAADAEADETMDYLRRIALREGGNTETLRRQLRMARSKYYLGYKDGDITDAVSTWVDTNRQQAKLKLFHEIKYEKGIATGPEGQKAWQEVERACFDTSDTCEGFAIAVLKKFMWQVKRKAANLEVTDHLMPVFTGAQRGGKSTFVRNMCAPIKFVVTNANFNMVTDDRNIDIWKSSVLFMDEMTNFAKSDVDAVKNLITLDTVSRRPMGQNGFVSFPQLATFIGCANKSLAQLVRDETGGRRFAELVWSKTPDWPALAKVDWVMLWRSVDERGPDPIGDDVIAHLNVQQEENRNKSPVEIWAREAAETYKGKKVLATDLYLVYRDWQKEMFENYKIDSATFGKIMTNLITTFPDFPWSKPKRGGKGQAYQSEA